MMEFKLQVVISDDDQPSETFDLIKLIKPCISIENLGLTLAESKRLLKSLQETIIQEQINTYLVNHQCCPSCFHPYRIKDHKMKRVNTLFDMISLESPRFYSCNHYQEKPKSFSPYHS